MARAVSALAVIVSLGFVTAATAHAGVSHTDGPRWYVTTAAEGGSMFPNAGASTLSITVRNHSSHPQAVTGIVVSPAASDGNVVDDATGHAVIGCLAKWFVAETALFDPAANTAKASVRLVESGTNQNACRGVRVRLSVRVR